MSARRGGIVLTLAISLATLAGPAAGGVIEVAPSLAKLPTASDVAKQRWTLAGDTADRRFRIAVDVSYCLGAQEPTEIERVRVDEREQAIEITVRVRRFERKPDVDVCPGVATTALERVVLDRRIGGRVLLDGARRPPVLQVWPRPGLRCPNLRLAPVDLEAERKLNTRKLKGRKLPQAKSIARRFGCSIRVLKRDGGPIGAHTDDINWYRINVALRDGRIARIMSVG